MIYIVAALWSSSGASVFILLAVLGVLACYGLIDGGDK